MTNADVRARLEAYRAVHGTTYASISKAIGLDKSKRSYIQRFIKNSIPLPLYVLDGLDQYLKERGF